MKKCATYIFRSYCEGLYKNSQLSFFLHKNLFTFVFLFSTKVFAFFYKNIFDDFLPKKSGSLFSHKFSPARVSRKIFRSLIHREDSGMGICPGGAAQFSPSFMGKFSYLVGLSTQPPEKNWIKL